MSIIQDQLNFIKSPSSFVKQLTGEPRALWVGLRNVLAIAVLYEGAILLWALGSEGVTLPAFLRIPDEQYYFYELIFLIPMFIITWLLASSLAYVLSKAMNGNGSIDAILGGFGVSMAVSFYFSLIPDYIQSILWTTGWIPFQEYIVITSKGIPLAIVWTYLLAWFLAHVVFYSITIRHTQGLSKIQSAVVGLVSFLGSFAVWITIVR